MIGQMAIAIALPGFNDLGRSLMPTLHPRNRFYLQLSPLCPKMNKKSMRKVKGVTARFVHIEKFSLDFSSSSFAICVNLLHP